MSKSNICDLYVYERTNLLCTLPSVYRLNSKNHSKHQAIYAIYLKLFNVTVLI